MVATSEGRGYECLRVVGGAPLELHTILCGSVSRERCHCASSRPAEVEARRRTAASSAFVRRKAFRGVDADELQFVDSTSAKGLLRRCVEEGIG